MPGSPCPCGVPDRGTLGSYMQGWEYNNFLCGDIMSIFHLSPKLVVLEETQGNLSKRRKRIETWVMKKMQIRPSKCLEFWPVMLTTPPKSLWAQKGLLGSVAWGDGAEVFPSPEICKSKAYTSSVTKMSQNWNVKMRLVAVVVGASVPLVFLCSQSVHFHHFYKA